MSTFIYLGQIYLPNIDSIRYNIRKVYENYNDQFDESFTKSIDIHKQWNWEEVTEKYAIPRLREIYGV